MTSQFHEFFNQFLAGFCHLVLPCDATVLDQKIVVTPGLKLAVKLVIVLVTSIFECLMKVFNIGLVQVIWSQIGSTTKPPPFSIIFFRFHNLRFDWKIILGCNFKEIISLIAQTSAHYSCHFYIFTFVFLGNKKIN